MRSIAERVTNPERVTDKRINDLVRTELLPTIRDFNNATTSAVSIFQTWLIPTAAVSGGFFALSASHVDNNTMVGLALATATSTLSAIGSFAASVKARRALRKNPDYAGLSLIMKLQGKK